jgi:hypothetical protein
MLPKASALEFSIGGRGEVYPRQAEPRITLQKLPRRKDGSLSASSFNVAEGRLRLAFDTVIEGLDDVFLEMCRTRMCVHDRLTLGVTVLGISEAKHVHFDAGRHQSYHGMHVLRDAQCRVQGDRGPDRVDILLRDAAASQEVPGDIRAIDFEAMIRAAMLMGQAHVEEHRACTEQFGIEAQSATLACQSSPVVDAARMVKQQRRFGIPHQIRYFAREFAVGNSDSRKIDNGLNIAGSNRADGWLVEHRDAFANTLIALP